MLRKQGSTALQTTRAIYWGHLASLRTPGRDHLWRELLMGRAPSRLLASRECNRITECASRHGNNPGLYVKSTFKRTEIMVDESENMVYKWLMMLQPMFYRSRRWLMEMGPTRNCRAGAPQNLGSTPSSGVRRVGGSITNTGFCRNREQRRGREVRRGRLGNIAITSPG
jgi:hypothetical protein